MNGIEDPFVAARDIADAVLFEGYVLYPYRASAQKNRMRWQFGVLTPTVYAEEHGEASSARTEIVVDAAEGAELAVQVRFLHVQQRTVDALVDGQWVPTASLATTDAVLVPWDEGVEQRLDITVSLGALGVEPDVRTVEVKGSHDVEPVRDADGAVIGRLVREREPLAVGIAASTQALSGPYGAVALRVVVDNRTVAPDAGAGRDVALRRSLVAAHTLLAVSDGAFLSLVDPPEWARPAAAECVNEHTWPVVLGPGGRSSVVLSSPIILDDDPQIAPESPGTLYDGLEIDEILTLRTMALTDEEKREARGTDPRAAAVIDRVDNLPPEVLDRLHGAVRYLRDATGPVVVTEQPAPPEAENAPFLPWWDPDADASVSPETDTVAIAGIEVGKGARVRLNPRLSGSDAQDLFLVGLAATVQGVFLDVDGGTHLAVTIDDDPAADLQVSHGRFRYFRPEEVEVLEVAR